jgi:hypothetical protein
MTAILVAGQLGVCSSVDLLSCLPSSADQEATGGVLRRRCLGGEPSCRAELPLERHRRSAAETPLRWSAELPLEPRGHGRVEAEKRRLSLLHGV